MLALKWWHKNIHNTFTHGSTIDQVFGTTSFLVIQNKCIRLTNNIIQKSAYKLKKRKAEIKESLDIVIGYTRILKRLYYFLNVIKYFKQIMPEYIHKTQEETASNNCCSPYNNQLSVQRWVSDSKTTMVENRTTKMLTPTTPLYSAHY